MWIVGARPFAKNRDKYRFVRDLPIKKLSQSIWSKISDLKREKLMDAS